MSDHEQLRLPDFIGIGPQRTGTTWLHNALEGVAVLPRGTKETHFFSDRYHKGISWYADHFRHGAAGVPIGEFDPNFFRMETIDRIHTHLPNCRLICTMRDPVDRAYSYYKNLRRFGYTRANFEDWLPEIPGGNRYASYLRLWQERFGKEQVMVTFYDDLVTDPQGYFDKVCDFIGVRRVALAPKSLDPDARNRIERAPRNARLAWLVSRFRDTLQEYGAYSITRLLDRRGFWKLCLESGNRYQPLSPAVDARVREKFRPEVEALEAMLGRDLEAWKRPRCVLDLRASASA